MPGSTTEHRKVLSYESQSLAPYGNVTSMSWSHRRGESWALSLTWSRSVCVRGRYRIEWLTELREGE